MKQIYYECKECGMIYPEKVYLELISYLGSMNYVFKCRGYFCENPLTAFKKLEATRS